MHTSQLQDVEAPLFLKNLKGWLVWRYEQPPSGQDTKPLKVPYYINGSRRKGANGTPEDRALLTDFKFAKQFAINNQFTGVGLALMPEFGITALDFDNVIDELTGDVRPDVLRSLQGTYAEYSPSGFGIRAFVSGDFGNRKSPSTNEQFGFELFNTKGFVTFTGKTIYSLDISPPSSEVLSLINSRWGNRPVPQINDHHPQSPAVPLSELREALLYLNPECSYHEWVATGMGLHYETNGSDEGFTVWDSWSANSSSKYASEEYNRNKWNSFSNATGARMVTGRTLLKMASAKGYTGSDLAINFEPINDTQSVNNKTTQKGVFNIRTAAEYGAEVKPISWLIKGFLPKANLGVLYGESGSGKSFIALDVCAALSRGVRWNNLRSSEQSRRILYVVAEGAGGFANRLNAYCLYAGISLSSLNIDIISDVTPNLVDAKNVQQLIQDIHDRQTPYDLIVMDTFAQVTPGANENSGEDMGKALAYCKQMSQITDAMVLLVHHSGKDGTKGARGWSGIKGAADAMIEVLRDDMNNRKLKVVKLKDGTEGDEYGFKLNNVILGHDEDGDSVTSCVVEYCNVAVKLSGLRENQQLIVDLMNDLELYDWVTPDHLLTLCVEHRGLKDGEELRNIRANFKKVIGSGVGKFLTENESGSIRLMLERKL